MVGKRILLVEGKDDEHVVKHLCGNCGGPRFDGDGVRQYEGINNLLKILPVQLKSPAITLGSIVCVIVDADEDINNRWRALYDQLAHAGYQNIPASPAPGGTIVEPPPPGDGMPRAKVGIWLMPDNQSKGILEDFLRFLVPPGSPLFQHVEASVRAIPGKPLFTKLAEPKALIHTWLAWQEEPGEPYGTAITAKFLDPDAPQAKTFVAWLNRLFS